MGIRGRLPGVRFPIRRSVVISGATYVKELQENQKVACVHCGQLFPVNSGTAFHLRHALDDMPYLRCPHCCGTAAVVYYLK